MNVIQKEYIMEKVRKYVFGSPLETEAVIQTLPAQNDLPQEGAIVQKDGQWQMTIPLGKNDIVYGLGETVRGINKRGWEYISWNSDDPNHDEDRRSLYGSHNFVIVDPGKDSSRKPFGLFLDQPGRAVFDIGYTRQDEMVLSCQENLNLYLIEGNSPYEVARTFRKLIGRSYIAPYFAFGYGQSRWGYQTKEDFFAVRDGLQKNGIPVDMIYMDIDYMQDFKDFTLHNDEFEPSFRDFVQEMKKEHIHLVPIIDAGVKVQDGYSVYEEGRKNQYFCKLEDRSSDFIGAVWPGYSAFPDFLNPEARNWFGIQYHVLTDAGIDAFWNDMNEPALFYSQQGMHSLKEYLATIAADPQFPRDCHETFALSDHVNGVKNSMEDYRRFYHHVNGDWVRHDLVHNLYGYKMTQAASDAFSVLRPGKRTLMFSRSSYIGAHRCGGIWTGDNKSWWSHLDLLVHQLPALSMTGFLYSGADLGGFGADATRDLVLRFTQIGLFTPLMRNHAALGTREQEPYQFEHPEDFAFLIQTRYRLIPWLYSEYMKAVLEDDLLFRPLAFDFPEDSMARQIENQLMVGHEIMIAPVTAQNQTGRMVYLPEAMIQVTLSADRQEEMQPLPAGWRWVEIPENEVVFFIRQGKALPVAREARNTAELDTAELTMLGWPGAEYTLYEDDGISSSPQESARLRTLKVPE